MAEIIVAGGGLGGAAAATALAQAGRAVTVIERESGPHDKICGEFLSGEAQTYLARLGFDPAPLGGHVISHLRLVRGGRFVVTALPFSGLGLSRRALDEALLRHAATAGAKIIRGHAIRRIDQIAMTLDVSGLGEMPAGMLLLATGKHELRGAMRAAAAPNDLVGFKMYFALAPAQHDELARHIELIMFRQGYAGLQLVEDGKANFCALVQRSWLQAAGGAWAGMLAALCRGSAHLAARLHDAIPLLPAPLTIARVPYGYVHGPREDGPARIFRLGDQAAVIQSFTGDGMAIALHSAALAAEMVRQGASGKAFQLRLSREVSAQIGRAGTLYGCAATPALQPALFNAARAWPAGLALAAMLTRVPARYRISSTRITSNARPSPPP